MTNIVTSLNESETLFSFTKADGSTRNARGTTNMNLIPEAARVATAPNTEASTTIKYYDLDKNAWRSFTRSNLVESSVRTASAAA